MITSIKDPYSIIDDSKVSKEEQKSNKELLTTLREISQFGRLISPKIEAGIEEANKKKAKIIKEFTVIVNDWIKGVNEELQKDGEAKIMIYGSHATGSALVDDDIDILILAPDYCERYTNRL